MKQLVALIALCLLLNGCTQQWSKTGHDGMLFEKEEPLCRELARASAKRQMPFFYDRDYGPAGFPPMSRHDIENMETARCLEKKGFKLFVN